MTFPISEPPIAEDDTRRRQALAAESTAPIAAEAAAIAPDEAEAPIESRGGCARLILPGLVLTALAFICVALVGLAGVAGYRDGVNDGATRAAGTRISAINTQLPRIADDLHAGRFDLALKRCQYVATVRPADPQIVQCLSQAAQALSATPTPSPSATATGTATVAISPTASALPASTTPNVPPTATLNGTTGFLDSLWAQAQDSLRKNDYATAIQDLEALREYDPTYNARQIFQTLCSTYETQGRQNEANNQLSEMVVVINKALKLNCTLKATDWTFTIDVVELYLSAKGYADAGNYALADKIFRDQLMPIDSGYLDTKRIACDTFTKAGDTAAFNQYCK